MGGRARGGGVGRGLDAQSVSFNPRVTPPLASACVDGVRKYCLKVGVQNLGSGGWNKQGAGLPPLMKSCGLALLGLNEVHQAAGACYEMWDRCTVIPSGELGNAKGGSALMVDGRVDVNDCGVESVERVCKHCTNDCVWYRVSLLGGHMLYLCVLYLRPWESGRVCPDANCDDGDCNLVHDEPVLTRVRASADIFSATGAWVCVIGDFNGSPPLEEVDRAVGGSSWLCRSEGASKRWAIMQRTLLCAVDDGGGHGDELPGLVLLGRKFGWSATRRPYSRRVASVPGGEGLASILDHALVTCDTLPYVSSFEVVDAGVSDHSLVVVTFEWSVVGVGASQPSGPGLRPDDPTIIPKSRVPMELRRVFLKHDDALNQRELTWRWELYQTAMSTWCQARLDQLDGLEGDGDLPTLHEMLHMSIDALARAKLSCHHHGSDDVPHASAGADRDTDLIEAALQARYAELATVDPETARMLTEVDEMIQRRIRAERTKRDVVRKVKALPVANRTAIALQQRRWDAAVVEGNIAHDFFKRLTRLRRQESRRHVANITSTAIVGGNHVVVARMISALGKTVQVWRRRKKTAQISRDELAVWCEEFTSTYVNRPVMTLDPAVHVAAAAPTAVAGLPDLHGVRDPAMDALLNGDVTVDEVRRAMNHLKGTSAATGVPNRVVKAAVTSAAHVELYARIFSSYLRDPNSMPVESFGVVACPFLKPQQPPGPPGSYRRKLAVGWSDSRLLQCVFAHRLLTYFHHTRVLDPSQHGFLYGCSVEQAMWLSHALSDPGFYGRKTDVYHILLDITTAFASAQHAAILAGLARLGVVGRLWMTLKVFLANANVTMSGGDSALRPITVRVGLCEGWVLSPVLFSVQLDGLLVRLANHASGNPRGYPIAAGHVFTNISFADDIDLVACNSASAQSSVNVVAKWMDEHHMRLNLKPGKSEVVMMGPVSRQSTLFLDEAAMRFVFEYKLLGRMISSSGPLQSFRLMLSKVTNSAKAAFARGSASGLRDARVSQGRVYVLTRIRVGATYGIGIWGVDAPSSYTHAIRETSLHLLDRKACAAVLRMDRAPWPVVQNLLGVVALPMEYVKAVLRILFNVLSRPRGHHLRLVLHRGYYVKDAWWWAARKILVELDNLETRQPQPSDVVSSVYQKSGVQWLATVEKVIQQREPSAQAEQDAVSTLKSKSVRMVEWLDWSLLQQAIPQYSSLAATRDLLEDESVTLGTLYFLRLARTRANVYRCHLRGGTLCLFSYEHYRKKCPFCKSEIMTVPHLLMECPDQEQRRRRRELQVELRRIASTGEGGWTLMDVDAPLQEPCVDDSGTALPWTNEQRSVAVNWYRLIVGASVPSSFLHTSLFTIRDRSQLPRGDCAERDAHQRIYSTLLDVSGHFIVWVFKYVAVHFGATKYIHTTDLLQE